MVSFASTLCVVALLTLVLTSCAPSPSLYAVLSKRNSARSQLVSVALQANGTATWTPLATLPEGLEFDGAPSSLIDPFGNLFLSGLYNASDPTSPNAQGVIIRIDTKNPRNLTVVAGRVSLGRMAYDTSTKQLYAIGYDYKGCSGRVCTNLYALDSATLALRSIAQITNYKTLSVDGVRRGRFFYALHPTPGKTTDSSVSTFNLTSGNKTATVRFPLDFTGLFYDEAKTRFLALMNKLDPFSFQFIYRLDTLNLNTGKTTTLYNLTLPKGSDVVEATFVPPKRSIYLRIRQSALQTEALATLNIDTGKLAMAIAKMTLAGGTLFNFAYPPS